MEREILLSKFDDRIEVSSTDFPEFRVALSLFTEKAAGGTVFMTKHEANQLIAALQEAVRE